MRVFGDAWCKWDGPLTHSTKHYWGEGCQFFPDSWFDVDRSFGTQRQILLAFLMYFWAFLDLCNAMLRKWLDEVGRRQRLPTTTRDAAATTSATGNVTRPFQLRVPAESLQSGQHFAEFDLGSTILRPTEVAVLFHSCTRQPYCPDEVKASTVASVPSNLRYTDAVQAGPAAATVFAGVRLRG